MIHWTIFLVTEPLEEAVEGGLFDINATLPLMAIQFVILVALLNMVFYKPLTKAIEDRAEYVRKNLADAREKKEKSENLAKQYEQELFDVRRKSQEIIGTAQAEAQKIISSQMQEAQQEVAKQRQEAAAQIENEKANALTSLEQEVDTLSNQIVTKLLGPELAK